MTTHDRIDVVTYLAIAGLVAVLGMLILGDAGGDTGKRRPLTMSHIDAITRERSSVEKYLGHYPPGLSDLQRLASFAGNNPRASLPFLLMGELHHRDGRLEQAIIHYRKALEINRAYADPKSGEYRGKQIEPLVELGLKIYQREKTVRPEDEDVRKIIKDLYFIKRSLAGGCD